MKKKLSKATTLCGMAVVASGIIIAGAVNSSNNADTASVFVPQETVLTKEDVSLDMSFLDEAGVTVLEIGETNYLGGRNAELTGNDESADDVQNDASGSEAESDITDSKTSENETEEKTVSEDENSETVVEEVKKPARNYVGTTVISTADPFVNVRENPDAQSAIVGKFFKNAVGTVTGQTEDWFKIKSGNVEGYVKAEFVAAGSDAVDLYTKVVKYYVTVSPASLNVRKQADTGSAVVAKVKKDETYKVLKTEGEWYLINTGDATGYIKKDYVQLKTAVTKAKTLTEIKEEEAAAKAKAEAEAKAKAEAEAKAKAKAEAEAKAKAEAAAKAKAEAAAKAKAEAEAKAKAEAKLLADDAKSKSNTASSNTTSKTTTQSDDSNYNETDLALLVALIHCEARWEPYEGKVALANIALNRVKSSRFPNTVYAVLHQRNQFTVVKKQAFKNTVKNYKENHSANMQETIKAAKAALDGYNNVGNRVFYNGARWETRRSHNNPLQIGAHLFWSL